MLFVLPLYSTGILQWPGFNPKMSAGQNGLRRGTKGEERRRAVTLTAVTDSFISHRRAPDEPGWCSSANNMVNCVL